MIGTTRQLIFDQTASSSAFWIGTASIKPGRVALVGLLISCLLVAGESSRARQGRIVECLGFALEEMRTHAAGQNLGELRAHAETKSHSTSGVGCGT